MGPGIGVNVIVAKMDNPSSVGNRSVFVQATVSRFTEWDMGSLFQLFDSSQDKGNIFLRNVGMHLQDYMLPQLRRLHSMRAPQSNIKPYLFIYLFLLIPLGA
jgi:hypothetical protein